MSPFIRQHDAHYSISFLLFGFLLHIFIPSLPPSVRKGKRLLNANSSIIFAPLIEFVDVPELFALGVRSYAKSIGGLSHLTDD
jgi:hypothetical protein